MQKIESILIASHAKPMVSQLNNVTIPANVGINIEYIVISKSNVYRLVATNR